MIENHGFYLQINVSRKTGNIQYLMGFSSMVKGDVAGLTIISFSFQCSYLTAPNLGEHSDESA